MCGKNYNNGRHLQETDIPPGCLGSIGERVAPVVKLTRGLPLGNQALLQSCLSEDELHAREGIVLRGYGKVLALIKFCLFSGRRGA